MRRGAKPGKARGGTRRLVARKPPKNEASRVRQLQERLEEAREREAEALEQQTATSEILRIISSSPSDIQPVFDAIAANAARLCDAINGLVIRFDGQLLHLAAHHNVDPERLAAVRQAYPRPPSRGALSGRAILTRAVVHVPDVSKDPEYTLPAATTIGYRSVLAVPMMHEGVARGTILVARDAVAPFSDTHIALIQTFADQAVIAIENVRLFKELEARNRDLTESLEQQTATADILKVISSSPTDVQPVFDAIAERAVRLCDGIFGGVWRFDGELFHFVAQHRFSPEALELLQRQYPMRPRGLMAQALREGAVVHSADVLKDPRTANVELALTLGYRSQLTVPMMRGGQPIGMINVYGVEAGPFSDKQIALLQTFADQAVIAIENVRLFTELEGRNRDLTATSEILRVISSSPTDVQPVFDTVVDSARRLLDGHSANVLLVVEGALHLAALTSTGDVGDAAVRANFPAPMAAAGVAPHVIKTRRPYVVTDTETDPLVTENIRRTAPLRGYRSMLFMPLIRDEQAIGLISVTRRSVGTFSDNEIGLLKTFADQAVIAIENVRLFNETKEALEQQTATSEILGVISSSPTDVKPVFQTILSSTNRLCEASFSVLWLWDGEALIPAAHANVSPELVERLRTARARPRRGGSPVALAALEQTVIHVPDVLDDPRFSPADVPSYQLEGARSILSVPMLRDGRLVGVINTWRREPRAFTNKQVELLKTFANQAVIAIENVRLFTELQARTTELTRSVEQLTALGEISQAVSSTLDVETVLQTIVSRATQLAGADGCAIYEYDDATEAFHIRATHNLDPVLVGTLRATPLRKGEGAMGRAAETREPTQIADIEAPGAYQSHIRDTLLGAGYRALLSVPLLREGEVIGSLSLNRHAPGEFPPEVIDVLKTFATQSALAIQNARLFREIADKSRQLEVASRHKSEFLANMSHELRTPLNAIIGFSEVLVDRMFGELNEKQEEYLKDIYASGQHLLSLINDILDLSKIEAGRMELELADFDLPSAIDNALTLVRERASRRGITLGHTIDERLGPIRGDERKVKQVLLNLLSNALKFTPEGGRIDVSARVHGDVAEVSVADTGVGIAPEDQEAVFEEFRQVGTADKKVEGTGLGLALSRKFIELHGGRIWVTSQVGHGSTFTFTLLVRRED